MSKTPDVRWRQRFQSFRQAFTQLAAGADLAKQRKLSDLEQQGLIQARNRSSHTYNAKTANEVAAAILTSFVTEFTTFRVKFTELEAMEP